MIDKQKLIKAIDEWILKDGKNNPRTQAYESLKTLIELGKFDIEIIAMRFDNFPKKPKPAKNQSITLTRTICPTCGRILIEGELTDTLIMRCQNCGDLYRVYSYGAMPYRLTKWQEEINVTE